MHDYRVAFLVSVVAIPIVLSGPVLGQPSVSGYAQLTSTIDELVERQSLGLEAMYFGGQGFLDDGRTAVTPYGFFGGYEYEGIMAGAGVSVQTEALLPFGVGLASGLTDADFLTWSLALNAQERVELTTWSTFLVQGVFGYQRLTEGRNDYYAVYLHPAEWPDTPEDQILFDAFGWYTFYIHAVIEARWRFVKPMIDFGWLASRYRYTGYECGLDCFDPGGSTAGDGTVTGGTVGFGLSLDADAFRVFGGLKWTDAGAIFPVSLSIIF
jgi:hypothetical protein